MRKTKIKSELLLASKNAATGVILHTFRLTFPRIILPEILTHRTCSRNTASTRAIPTIKMIKAVLNDPFVPTHIGRAQKGMQAGAELTGIRRFLAVAIWRLAGYTAAAFAYLLYKTGVAKQIAGRIVEPFSWTTQILSATELDNFFALRVHDAAEPHLHELARQMKEQVELVSYELNRVRGFFKRFYVQDTLCQTLQPGEWHLPLTDGLDPPLEELKQVSAARCARTSYTLIETGKKSTVEADIKLCENLAAGGHYSPFEHQAVALADGGFEANFRSFRQYRKEIEDGKFASGLTESA